MSLEEIKAEALKLKALRDRKDSLMHELKEVNESISASEEHTLDSLMEDAGVSDVTVDGVRIKRGAIFRGGVTSSSERDKFKFLFDTDTLCQADLCLFQPLILLPLLPQEPFLQSSL